MADLILTIRVPDEGNVGLHVQAADGLADPRPALRKAIATLEAEIEGYARCPAHHKPGAGQ